MEELCLILLLGATSMIEPLLCGIVLGLFVAAWNQYRRGGSALGG